MKKKALAVFLSLFLCFAVMIPVVFAQIDIEGTLANTGEGIYGAGEVPSDDLPVIVGNLINIVLSFLGVVLVVVIIYGGFLYMTAGGEPAKADKGKQWIINGIIGMIIILASYGITSFVVTQLLDATT